MPQDTGAGKPLPKKSAVSIDPVTGAPITDSANRTQDNPTNQFTEPTPATVQSTSHQSDIPAKRPDVTNVSENKGNTAPFNNPPKNASTSQDLVPNPDASFAEKEVEHPHATTNTPNTTMSGGPFNPHTLNTRNADGTMRTNEIPMPVKTLVRHPFTASGEPATPVALQEKPLNETEVDQKIAEILKNNGLDSASQLRAFSEIKAVLNAWEPNPDTDKVITAETARAEEAEMKAEVDAELKSREEEDENRRNLEMSDEERKAEEDRKTTVTAGPQASQTVKS